MARLQGDNQPLRLRERIEPPVGLVFGLAGEIELCNQAVDPTFNREVNVRWPHFPVGCRIATWLNGAERVAAGSIGRELREALEIRIERRWVGVARMTVFARRISLPGFYARMRAGLAPTCE